MPIWEPQPGPQADAIRAAFVDELFFGGARGGGKSDYLIGDYAADIAAYGAAWRGVLFRKTHPDLEEIEYRTRELFPALFPGCDYKVGTHTWRFPNGAWLRLRHLDGEMDADKYLGHQYTWIGWDELPLWPNLKAYHRLKACLRSAAGVQNMRIRATGNPGGPGHQEVKRYFRIDGDSKYGGKVITDEHSGMTRMFIRSLVQDNKILMDNDPHYVERLKTQAHGDPQLVKAWLDGDWDAFVGQYFEQWNDQKIRVPAFEIPESWPLFGGMDYGEAKPTSFGLYTVDFDDNVYRICEHYISNATASDHAYHIDRLITACPWTQGRRPQSIYADPSMWVRRRLTDAVANSAADIFAEQGLYLTPANNDRITGWRLVKDLLKRGRFFVFDGWNDNLCRTLPALPRSNSNPEDLDTRAEDHAADELRYALMHIYSPSTPKEREEVPALRGDQIVQSLRDGQRKKSRYAA